MSPSMTYSSVLSWSLVNMARYMYSMPGRITAPSAMPPPPEDGPLAGLTPAAYIQRIKIKNAKRLFDNNPQMSVKRAFNDYSNFVRAFKAGSIN